MGKFISNVFNTDTLSLSEQTDGYWLWDKTVEMNLGIKAKTERDAFIQALKFYQTYYKKYKEEAHSLRKKIDVFVEQFVPDEDTYF